MNSGKEAQTSSDEDEVNELLYAKLASASYAFEFGQDAPVPAGYEVDTSLSDTNTTIFTKGSEACVAFRGTDFLNWRDVSADVMLALGLEGFSIRFLKSLSTTNKAISKYGHANVSVTGHSLGGTQALFVNSKTGVMAVVFNPGASIPQAFEGLVSNAVDALFDTGVGNNAHIFTARGDVISVLSHFQNAHHHEMTAKSGVLGMHLMNTFTTDGASAVV